MTDMGTDTAALGTTRRRIVTVGSLVLGAMLALSAWGVFETGPGVRVPMHWNASGEVDRYGSRLEAFGLLPAVYLAVTLLFVVLPSIEPRQRHLSQSRRAYLITHVATSVLMLVLHAAIIAAGIGITIDMPRIAPGAVGLLLIVLGNYLGKVRSNFFFGIRTPWTLSSEMSWQRTHRLGGKLFMALGALMLGASVVPASTMLALSGAVLMVAVVVVLVVYSFLVWRQDPERAESGRR